ncbi:MAG: hypothetical protein FWF59_01450, partial [Turicibacter sp.]|nr:hypothetical protein [Turicibacter sp.]
MSNYNNSHGCPPPACQPVCGCPAGQAPDGPMGPIGATGPAGPGIISEYNPDDASSYKKGQLIVDNGNLYLVNKDDPQGVPGSSPDYTLLAPDVTIGPTGPEGPMGPPGIKIPTTFNPGDSSNYVEGQLIYDNGKIYIVNKDNPEGIPGQSPDYTELSPDAVPGPEGPTGPGGVDVPQDFNPDDAANYTVGNLIYYNGRLYVVCRNHPSGVPGSSPDYCPVNADVVPGPTGPGGPPGIALPVTWDAGDASSYAAGTIVYYNGNLYYVNKGNPSGTPGSSPDYDLIDPGPVPGPTGPTGIGAPAQWQPDDTVNLMQGQLVQYGDKLYVVNKDAPQGVPDSSPDYSEVQTKIESEGDTGPAGPTGPQGECGCDDQIIDNAVKVAALLACANDCISLTNQNDINIGHLYDMLGDLEGQINDNEDKLDEIEGANDPETQEQLDKYTTYCSGDPTHANASGGTSATTAIVSQGSPTDIGCFFGCTIYRQCYY